MTNNASVLVAPCVVQQQQHAVLTGVSGAPLVLWHQPTRDLHAMTNVEEARRLPATITPIFFGVEHLPCLAGRWPTDRAAIIIEKSQLHYEQYCARQSTVPHVTAPVQLCVGEWGFATLPRDAGAKPYFEFQETAHLALQCMRLPDDVWHAVQFFLLPEHDCEIRPNDLLLRALHLIVAAKKFHADNATRYAAWCAHPPSDALAILLRYAHESQTIDREFAAHIPVHQRRTFVVGDYGYPIGNWEIFAGTPLARTELTSPAAEKYLAPFFQNAQRFLEFLEAERPCGAAFRNRSPFCTLEDTLLLEEMLQRLHIPTHAFFYDLYSHMTNTFEGGWSVPLVVDLNGTAHTHHVCTDGYTAARYGPRHIPVHHYPFHYLHPDAPITPPVAARSELQRDVAIMHQCRDESMHSPLLNEMFEMGAAFATDGACGGPTQLVGALRKFLETQAPLCQSYFWQTLVNSIDFNFYAQARIRWVIAVAHRLRGVSVQVFGAGWERYLPATLCAGQVPAARVPEIYRTSGCTIHCSMVNTVRLPHANVVSCLAAGGLPLALYPAFGDPQELGHAFLTAASLPYFRTLEELEQQLQQYLSDWSARTALITQAQTGWLAQLHRSAMPSLAELQRSVVVPENLLPPRITHDPALDQWLLHAALGYLYVLSGFPATALEIWSTLLSTDVAHYIPFALRVVHTALEMNERVLAHTIWQRARHWSPDHFQVLQIGQQQGWGR